MHIIILISCKYIFIALFCVISKAEASEDDCRHLEFRGSDVIKGMRLMGHVIHSTEVINQEFCGALCFMEPSCFSYNFMTKRETGKHKCELNNATHKQQEEDLEENSDYVYRGAKNHCSDDPCNDQETCQTGFTSKGYRCQCNAGFTGHHCTEIDECAAGSSSCDANAECINNIGSYTCSCRPGYHGDGKKCEDVDECTTGTHNCAADDRCNNMNGSFNCTYFTCKELYNRKLLTENKAYELKIGSKLTKVYCVMDDAEMGPCSGAGWTLIMKINGTKQTFSYDANLWSDYETFNQAGGETGFDTEETKLPTYWSTPFSKICLGMKIPGSQTTNFIAINKTSNSLYSLIADGQYHATSLGRDKWKTLIGSRASLQMNCNKEGFNAYASNVAKARIGILGNNENNCLTCDSFIGFGTGGRISNNGACGDRHTKVMGYVLIK